MKRDYTKEPLRIFIGVGHGGKDSGAVNSTLNITEASCNLAVAMLMQKELKRHGVQVKLSRYADETDLLKEEIAECNAYAPDFAVEIHTNAGGGTGFEVYYQLEPWANSKASLQMATLFDKNVCQYLGVNTRGLKTNQTLGWLKQVEAPCILVENFFLDGPRAQWYCQPEQLEKLSKAYARSILDFYNISYLPDSTLTLRYRIVTEDLMHAKNKTCPAVLLNGHYYVQLRQFVKNGGMATYYDASSKQILIYPPEYYAESDFQSGLLKISDFATPAECTLAGISLEEAESWHFDEYDTDYDQKEDSLCLH